MGQQGSSSPHHTLEETLEVFTRQDRPGTPLTTNEVAEELDCARRTAYGKLEELADRGALETKKVGARGRVWWRPPETETETESSLEQAQFREMVETVTDYAIFVLDADGYVQTWNEGAHQLKGYEEAEIVGEHFSAFYTDEDAADGRPDRNLETAAEEGRVEDEGWRVRDDGTTFWANVTITALTDDDSELKGFIKVTRDMTERHAQEERLRTQKERFETLVREVKDYAIFLLDADGYVQTWNEGAHQLKGYEEAEIVGEHFSEFYTDEDTADGRPQRNLEMAAEEGRVEDEGWRVRDDGTTFWANVTITALYDDDGEVSGYAKVTRDMTERHEYEERLRAQRDELDELNQINAVIRDIDQALVTATTRKTIEQAVCDRLAASGTYSAAWIAEYTDDYQELTPRTWNGISEEYLRAIREAADDGTDGTEVGVGATALQTRSIQPVQDLDRDVEGEPWREASIEAGFASAVSVPLVYNETEYGVLTVYADHESAFDQRKIEVLSELGETISHAIAAIRRKERERTLTALQESTRELLHADEPSGVGDVIVETLTEDLTLADAVVYYFDTAENALEPVSTSFQSTAPAERLSPLTAGVDSSVWESFMEGESRVTDDVIPSREVGRRRTMVVPLGDHGVVAVAAAPGETFDGDIRNLVQLVAATGEAAFDRIESQANLRERDELLQAQNQRLQRLNSINTIIREIDQGLVKATTREEVEATVCERLIASDRFRFAWIGEPDELDDGIVPRAWDGEGRGYLDSIDLAAGHDRANVDPAVTAAETGEVTVVSNVANQLRVGQWRKEAFSREFQSVISVPLHYGEVTYGVLTVYADRPDVFEEMEQSVFAELGETIANAIHALDTKQALLSDNVVELEFQIRDGSTSFLARLAGQLAGEVALEGAIPLSEGRARLFFVVHDTPAETIRDVLERSIAVESHHVVAARDDGHLVEAVVSDSTLALSLLDQGATPRTITVTEDGIHLVVELPAGADVRGFVERLQAEHDDVEFLARREHERPARTREGLYSDLEDRLTDRQIEVLKTAYLSGYYASPRESTGGDLADLLDVSQPTVSEQLRRAEQTILELLLTE